MALLAGGRAHSGIPMDHAHLPVDVTIVVDLPGESAVTVPQTKPSAEAGTTPRGRVMGFHKAIVLVYSQAHVANDLAQ